MDEQSLKILNYIRKNNSVTIEQLKVQFAKIDLNSYVEFLLEKKYIKGTSVPYYVYNHFTKERKEQVHSVGPYIITPSGVACLEETLIETKYRRIRLIHDWINTAIALFALVISIISVLLK